MWNFKTGFNERLFRSLDNNAVMMRVEDDGAYYPVWCSKEFTEMMEGTEEDFIRLESGGTMSTIHPEDQGEVAYLLKHHKAKDGANSLTIQAGMNAHLSKPVEPAHLYETLEILIQD